MAHTRRHSDHNGVLIDCELMSDNFPVELVCHISQFLDAKAIHRVRQTCRSAVGLFERPFVDSAGKSLLRMVMDGNKLAAQNIIVKLKYSIPNLYHLAILNKADGVEDCGRVWKISPLEFAMWSGDIFILRMLLANLEIDFLPVALSKLQYLLANETQHGLYLSALQPIYKAYEIYDREYIHWDYYTRKEFFIRTIGGAQANLPIYILQELLSPQELNIVQSINNGQCVFHPTPRFEREPERLCRLESGISLLPISTSGLGTKFSVHRDKYEFAHCVSHAENESLHVSGMELSSIRNNLLMLRYLERTRRQDLEKIMADLSHSINQNILLISAQRPT